MKEAMLYDRLPDSRVRCGLCAHRCLIAPGRRGFCQVRENRGGTLESLVYGRLVARHADPIEKKPLFHFFPGSISYSVAAAGCNMHCRWCQNWEISQMPREQQTILGEPVSPEECVEAARRCGARSIAYTYTEPTVFFEYSYDVARLARPAGLANIYVTNGFMTTAMLDAMHPFLDAANVDLKAFRDETYRAHTGARLAPVLDSLRHMKRLGVWVEVTTLLVPGVNDDPGELGEAAAFLARDLGVETPWHLSRFFPMYRLRDRPLTPGTTLEAAREIGLQAGLKYVYLGNMRSRAGEETRCPDCGKPLIERHSFAVLINRVRHGRCPHCGVAVAGVGLDAANDR